VASSFVTYADPKTNDGYFLWLLGVPEQLKKNPVPQMPRELIVVIDRSGSMAGPKMEQARTSAVQLLESLSPGEAFNVIDYSNDVARFAEAPVLKNETSMADARAYLKSMSAGGGTNINDALQEALRQPTRKEMLPLVVFLTDGVPTTGVVAEKSIREEAEKANVNNRRIFTFGVGYDVNAPLLDQIARASRAASAYVQPQEKVEAKVAELSKRFRNPMLVRPRIEAIDASGGVSNARVRDVAPREIPDLFAGDQLVVLGRYVGKEPFRLRLTGEAGGKTRSFEFALTPAATQTQYSYVARLWASRKIGDLIDEVRLAGAKGIPPASDASTKETVDQIVDLSTRFGVLTEYTSFFASDPVDLSQREIVHLRVRKILADRAQAERTGQGAVAQAINVARQRQQNQANRGNAFLDGNLREVRLANIQQRNDRALFRRGVTWVDSQVFEKQSGKSIDDPPDRVIEFGTQEYFDVVRRLAAEGRPGVVAVNGKILMWLDGQRVLIGDGSN
jgi:Ca-activated chloride channel family protein